MDVEQQAIENASSWMADAIRQYVDSEGATSDHAQADWLVVLYTTGRKSGLVRGAPLVGIPEGDDILVMASKRGAPTHPEWYNNLVADPNVWVRNKADFHEAKATTLTADEREERWPAITEQFPFYADYQADLDREIPVVRLQRR